MGDADTLMQLLPTAAGGVAFVYAFLFLLRRGDSQQRENIDELRRQRDEGLSQLRELRGRVAKLERQLTRYLRLHGPLPSDQMTDEHDLDAIRRKVEEERHDGP